MVIPYRNMPGCRAKFLSFLAKCKIIQHFNIMFVEQFDDGKRFNLGKLLNVGFDIFRNESVPPWVFMYHAVDLFPSDDMRIYLHHMNDMLKNNQDVYGFCCDWSQSGCEPHQFFQCAMFRPKSFELTNGYSNKYWGWGHEDGDFFHRLTARQMLYLNLPTHMYFFDENRDEIFVKYDTGMKSPDKFLHASFDEAYQTFMQHGNYPNAESLMHEGLNNASYSIVHRFGVQQNVQHVIVKI